VAIHGTFRTFDEYWRTRVHKLINEVAKETTGKFGLSYEVLIDKGYPVLINDDNTTQVAIEAAKDFLGE